MRSGSRIVTALVGSVPTLASIGCGPPAELRVVPSTIDHSARLGDDQQGAPLASTKFEIRSSRPEESLGWTMVGAPTWLQVAAVSGGTPQDVEIKFDLAAMAYGENRATLVLREKEKEIRIPIRYELLGALAVGPTQTVSLGGIAGEQRSSIAKLTVDSPRKPGLKWRAKTDDAWLVLHPTSGETPGVVSVYADLSKAGANAAGRIEFTADTAWRGATTTVPVAVHTLTVTPASVDLVARLGDDAPGSAPTAVKLNLTSSTPDESLGWTLAGAPPWLRLSATQGGTPADTELQFDLPAMAYGENVATLTLRNRDAEKALRVRYDLLGALRIGPTQSVTLRGVVGAEASSVVKLALDSPTKPGLRWQAKSDDPWMVIEPTSGTTPALVSVRAILAKGASNSSGRIVFTAESSWQGSPTVIPVVIEILNPAAIQKQIDAKLSLIRSERDDADMELKRLAEALRTPQGVDAVVQVFRSMADRAATSSRRMATLQQDLLGFLEQNSAYERDVGFAETRAAAAALVTEAETAAKRIQASVDGIRIGTLTVDSHAEWQRSDIAVNAGDFVAFEAVGKWKLGFMISDVGPAGLPTPSIRDPKAKGMDYGAYSVDGKYNHGCLLLRSGDSLIAGGASQGSVTASATGRIEGRCNDTKYTDNEGTVTVRVVVIPRR